MFHEKTFWGNQFMRYQRIFVAHLYILLMSVFFYMSSHVDMTVGFVFIPFVFFIYIYLLLAYGGVLHSVTFFVFFLHVYFFLRYLYVPIINYSAYVTLATIMYTFLLSVICGWFLLSYAFSFSKWNFINTKRVEVFLSSKYIVKCWNISLCLYILSWASMLHLSGYGSFDYISMIFNSLEIRKTLGSGFFVYLSLLSSLLFSSLIYSSLYLFLYFNNRIRLALTIFCLLFFFLPLGSRGAIVLQFFSIFVIVNTFRGRVNWFYLFVFFVFAIIFSVVYLSIREGGEAEIVGMQEIFISILSRFDSFDNVMMIWNSSNNELIYGKSIFDFLLQFIPRTLYIDKPYLFPSEMTRKYLPFVFDNGVTFDFSGIYEAYINFGAFGSILFGVWIGAFLKFNDVIRLWAFEQRSLFLSFLYSGLFMIPSFYFSIAWINSGVNIYIISVVIMNFVFYWFFVRKINSKINKLNVVGFDKKEGEHE